MRRDLYAMSAWVICPACPRKRCIGRDRCPEVKAWIEKREEAEREPKEEKPQEFPCNG